MFNDNNYKAIGNRRYVSMPIVRFVEGIENYECDGLQRVMEMLEKGFDPNAQYNGWSMVHHAVKNNNMPVLSVLLEVGANPCALDSNYDSPMHVASSAEILSMLLSTELVKYINHRNIKGETAYYKAWYMNDKVMQKQLEMAGANPHIPNEYGYLGNRQLFKSDDIEKYLPYQVCNCELCMHV